MVLHPGFKACWQNQLKSKTDVPVAPQNGDLAPQKKIKNKFFCQKQ